MRALLLACCLLALSIPAASADLGLLPATDAKLPDPVPRAARDLDDLQLQPPAVRLPDAGLPFTSAPALEPFGHAEAEPVRPATNGAPNAFVAPATAGPPAFVAMVVALAAWASTKLPLGTEWGRRIARLALAAPLALFSRIQSATLMDNPVRQGLVTHVQQNPGSSLREAQRTAGVAWGTAVYHLRRLEKDGVVVSLREGANRRYWVSNTPESSRRAATAQLLSPSARGLAQAILSRPGSHQAELAAAAGLSTATASRQLRRFEVSGLAIVVRQGHARMYQPGSQLAALLGDVGAAPLLLAQDLNQESTAVTVVPAA